MLALDNGDAIRGDASAASEVDYTLHGVVSSAITQLADGQLGDSEADLYAATADATIVTTITLVNTGAATRTVNLYLKPSGGTSRRIIPKDCSLPAGYSLATDGVKVYVMNTSGAVVVTNALHAASHTDGTDDIQSATAVQKGVATATQITKLDGIEAAADATPDATTTTKGKSELATIAEVDAGADAGRVVTPDALGGSIFGEKIVYVKVIANDTAVATGDGKAYITIPDALNGMNLVDIDIVVYTASTSGTPTVQIHNLTDTVDMLSTVATIDENEYGSYTAATPPVIDGDHDDVATGDRIRIDIDVAGTGTKGLDVILTFQLP